MRSGAWGEHARITEERIEDAGQAAGESDDRDVLAPPDRDPEAHARRASASGGRRRRMETAT
jgi:hypothetical protein